MRANIIAYVCEPPTRREFMAMSSDDIVSEPPVPSVLVSIVAYRTWDDLNRCIVSLSMQDYPKLTISVWDNGDERENWPHITQMGAFVSGTSENLGFGAGHNRNIAQAPECDLVLLLNPDIIAEGDFISRLVAAWQRLQPGALAPQLTSSQGVPERTVRTFPDVRSELSRAIGLDHTVGGTGMGSWPHDTERRVEQPPGAALLVSTASYEALGGFDESFPLYFDDVDFCFRLDREVGPIWFTPAARAIHAREGTARRFRSKSTFWIEWSRRRYIHKHFPARWRRPAVALAVTGAGLRVLAHGLLALVRADSRERAKGYALAVTSAFVGDAEYWRARML
jgi:GT2 family glycosyltransferase